MFWSRYKLQFYKNTDMNYLLACTQDDSLKLIDLRRNQIVSTYRTDGFKVAFGYTRACFRMLNMLYVGRMTTIFMSAVIATAWHPNGYFILSSDKNKHLILWNDF
ncbi:autophagy-related protein 16-like [Hydra vulgaris]|uniref:Autophagy-related protein 16-like n=1 Tax=Hydra vulgaris TaxID=6087 RepID=A0ABM4B4M2_HYDVU